MIARLLIMSESFHVTGSNSLVAGSHYICAHMTTTYATTWTPGGNRIAKGTMSPLWPPWSLATQMLAKLYVVIMESLVLDALMLTYHFNSTNVLLQ